jgi:hypothetical protein
LHSNYNELGSTLNLEDRSISMKYIAVRSASFVLAALMFAMVSSVAEAQSFCVLYAFSGNSDGYKPYGGVVLGSSGSLYGTTTGGGQGAGVVFEIKKDKCDQSQDNVLHEFGSIKNDGLDPFDTLLIDPTGKLFLYGTTQSGEACRQRYGLPTEHPRRWRNHN